MANPIDGARGPREASTNALAGAAPPKRVSWQPGTAVEIFAETARVTSIVLELPEWSGHVAGQYVDVRLRDPSGSHLQHSYWIASAPADGSLVITFEHRDDGELSRHLANGLRVGDQVELRGPLGSNFVWDGSGDAPLLFVAGGAGVVPFRSMLRQRAAIRSAIPVRLLYSSRSLDDVIYLDELMRLAAYDEVDIRLALTRVSPSGWQARHGRINREFLAETTWGVETHPVIYVSGPPGFVKTISDALVLNRHPRSQIRTERLGGLIRA
jgi:ferredoxin-NADP reductase